jgi:hypothetical protein
MQIKASAIIGGKKTRAGRQPPGAVTAGRAE